MANQSTRLAVATLKPALRKSAVTRLRPTPLSAPHVSVSTDDIAERVKAIADRAISVGLLIAALPLLAVCVLLVRLSSRGPALYSQRRVGRGGRVFTLYKIRTMRHDCEKQTGPRWSPPNDPRITPVGRVLRKLHLDEMPQLWNVMRGDMSLIGPRPERPEIVARLREAVPGYDRRHSVKPGITGYAQIHLPPDTCLRSVKNKLVYDLFYIRNRSPWMELYIILATGMKLLGMKKLYQRMPRVPTE